MRSTHLSALLWCGLALSGCGSMAADHEELGDRAYLAGSYAEALTEYRLAQRQESSQPSRLRAKTAMAALRAGDLAGAAQEYLALGRGEAQRVDEAAEGLDRVARAAADGGDRPALRAAVMGLREIAKERPPSALAVQAVQGQEGGVAEMLAVLPSAAAAAPDARLQDSLMFAYGDLLARRGRCEPALGIFDALARRQRTPAVVDAATTAAASCALRLGRAALDGGQPAKAEEWFGRAASAADDSPVGRAAYVGIGDVRYARGDFLGAAEAYQRALGDASPGDSVANVARERLNRIGNAGTVFPDRGF